MSEDTLQIQQYLKDNIDYILSKDNITIFFPPASGQYQDQQDVTVDLDQVFGVPLLASFDNNEMILKLLKENRKFSVDEEKRTVTVHMNTRTTIMLRDIPESTSQEDVKNLFGEYSSFIVDMKPEIGDNYLVDFKTADITQNAFVFVRQQTFNGKAVACCIKSNYNYYTPQYYFPPQENNNFFDYSKDYDENKRGRGGRGRGRGGKKYQNGNYRGNNTKPYYNRRNESPKVISQDLGSENFPPLSPNSTVRTVTAERKYPIDQLCDIVKGMDEVYPPDWTGTSIAVTDNVNLELEIGKFHPNANIDWINKRGTKPVPGENQNKEKPQDNTQENTSTTTEPKQEIIFPTTTTLRYADIVKQNVDKSPQPKSSNSTFNSYKGTFSVEVKEPKKTKKQQAETQKQQQTETPKTNPTSQEQPVVNPTN